MVLEEIQGGMDDIHAKGRLVDLEGLKEKQEVQGGGVRGTSRKWPRHVGRQYTQGSSQRGSWY